MKNKFKKDIKDFNNVAQSFYGSCDSFDEILEGYNWEHGIYFDNNYYYSYDNYYYYKWLECPNRIRCAAIAEILDLDNTSTTIGDMYQHQLSKRFCGHVS